MAEYLDHYSYLNSPVHRVPAHTKLLVAFILILLILLLPISWWWFHAMVGTAVVVTAIAATLPIGQSLQRLRWMWLVVLVLALGRLWQPDGLYAFLSALIKSTECLLIMWLIGNTTRFLDILAVLQALSFPKVLLTTLSLLYRYLFVLSDEKSRMQRARKARTFTSGRRRIWTLHANIISHLFVRCTERAERIHRAMCARGLQ